MIRKITISFCIQLQINTLVNNVYRRNKKNGRNHCAPLFLGFSPNATSGEIWRGKGEKEGGGRRKWCEGWGCWSSFCSIYLLQPPALPPRGGRRKFVARMGRVLVQKSRSPHALRFTHLRTDFCCFSDGGW